MRGIYVNYNELFPRRPIGSLEKKCSRHGSGSGTWIKSGASARVCRTERLHQRQHRWQLALVWIDRMARQTDNGMAAERTGGRLSVSTGHSRGERN